jgi:hypothetical protein
MQQDQCMVHSQQDSADPLTLNCLRGWLYSSVAVIQDLLLLTQSPEPHGVHALLLSQVCSSSKAAAAADAAAVMIRRMGWLAMNNVSSTAGDAKATAHTAWQLL